MNPGLYSGLSGSAPVAPVVITPSSVTTIPGAQTTFVPSGGTGTGYFFSLLVNNSGGSINSSTGVYTAGSNIDSAGDEMDVVMLVDSGLNSADANIAVLGPVSTGLKLWLKADAGVTGTSAVSAWADQSGNANNYVQATGGKQPALVTGVLNGLPVIRFDGASQFLTSGFQIGGAKTVVMVRKLASTPGASTFFETYTLKDASNNFSEKLFGNFAGYEPYSLRDDYLSVGNAVGIADALDTSWHVDFDTYDGGSNTATGSYTMELDGVSKTVVASSAFGRSAGDVPSLGARVNLFGNGASFAPIDVAEVLVWDHVLGSTDLTNVRAYLSLKYGI